MNMLGQEGGIQHCIPQRPSSAELRRGRRSRFPWNVERLRPTFRLIDSCVDGGSVDYSEAEVG